MPEPKNRWLFSSTAIVLVGGIWLASFAGVSSAASKSSLPTLIQINADGGGCGNNGHGNDDDHNDSSNPGNSNNGDGTDDDSTPGNKGGNADGDKGNCGASPS